MAQLHAVPGGREVRHAEKWLVDLGHLEGDGATVPFGSAELHGDLPEVRDGAAVGRAVPTASPGPWAGGRGSRKEAGGVTEWTAP